MGDEHGVLEMGGRLAVLCDDRPAIVENADGWHTGIDHGFDGQRHARHEDGRLAIGPVVWHLRFLVQAAAHAMAHELAHDTEAPGFHKGLHGAAQVGQAAAGAGMGNGLKQRLLGGGKQEAGFGRDVAGSHRGGVVANEAAFDDADVDFDDVPRHDPPGSTDAMDDFLIDGNTDLPGEAAVIQEGTAAIMLAHQFAGEAVDFASGAAGRDFAGKLQQDGGCGFSCHPHRLDLAR